MVFLTNVEVIGHTRGEDFDTQRCIGSENLLELVMPDEEVVSLLQENENVQTERTSFDLDLHDLWLANEEEMLAEYAATLEDVQQQLAESRRQRTERRQQWTEMEQRVTKMEQQLLEIKQQWAEIRQELGQLSPESMIWSIARDKSADGLELLLPKTC